jgi:arabinogalactan endo-1,4-beta-galactosidase
MKIFIIAILGLTLETNQTCSMVQPFFCQPENSSFPTHTNEVLTLLKNNDITPEWVQVGNETSDGMLWEDGRISKNPQNYAELNNAGYDAVKSVFPNAKVIVHLPNGYSNSLYRWFFDTLKNYDGKWDVIGMSVYPYWYTTKND